MSREHTTSEFHNLWTVESINSDGNGKNFSVTISRLSHEKDQPTEAQVLVCSIPEGKIEGKFNHKNTRNFGSVLNSDGTKVAYLEKTSSGNSLVIHDLKESISEKLKLEGSPQQIQWSGDSVLISMEDPLGSKEKSRKEEGYDGEFFEEEDRYTSLYIYYPGRGVKKLTENLQLWEFNENSGKVSMVVSEKPQERFWYRNKLYLLDLKTGKNEELYDPKWRTVAMPRISPDGKKVLFTESLRSDRGLNAGDLLVYDIESGKATNLTEGNKVSYMNSVWTEKGISAIWLKEGAFGISEYDNEWKEVWSAEGTALPAYASQMVYKDGTYYIGFTDRSNPPEVFAVSNGTMKKVTDFNSGISDLVSYPAEVVKWKAEDGTEIYGILRSVGPDRPIVVNVHGGPTAASTISFMDRSTIFLANGFSVFYPNYRGSTGMGRDYAEANRGDMGGKDFTDIMSGIDYLKKSGKLTTDNIFITGGSYGGFMTSWAVTQTQLFKGALGLFGISDWVSFHGVTNIPDWDQIHYDDDPYRGKLFRKFSPMEYIQDVKTPTLLMHGAQDPCVPVGQYYQFYRGLKDMGKTVRFLVFPREGHGFTERNHVEQFVEESLNWFRKYMD